MPVKLQIVVENQTLKATIKKRRAKKTVPRCGDEADKR